MLLLFYIQNIPTINSQLNYLFVYVLLLQCDKAIYNYGPSQQLHQSYYSRILLLKARLYLHKKYSEIHIVTTSRVYFLLKKNKNFTIDGDLLISICIVIMIFFFSVHILRVFGIHCGIIQHGVSHDSIF